MYTAADRDALRLALLERARKDTRISSGAITGSAAADAEDDWSDIDLAFAVGGGASMTAVLADWTRHLYGECDAVAHTDVHAGRWIYRVFLLRNTLQVDMAFVPQPDFRPLGPAFGVVFGEAGTAASFPAPDTAGLIGMAWLHALHVRSALARGRWWQAEYMLNGTRDHALQLACLRLGLSPHHARGYDQLPPEVLELLQDSIPCGLNAGELRRAFGVVIEALLGEVAFADPDLATRIAATLRAMV
ncbi:MAG: hypothetical protein JNK87_40920 [Bryobacterales bacterium]|nr:hypothetical protein [Bryobacterales bacterium]